MKILVTGGCGFLGSHIIEEVSKEGHEVVNVDNFSRGKFSKRVYSEIRNLCKTYKCDILDFKKLRDIITKFNPDIIYHMAALPSHRNALTRPHDYLQIDVSGTANVLEAARLCNKKPLVLFASSNKVYGKQECPWREDKLPQPEGPYAVSKWAAEKLCEMYTKYFDVPTVIIRYHHVAGKRSNPELALSVFTEQALKGEILEVHGKMKGKRFLSCSADYTHVDDAIKATLIATKKYKGFDIFNIANKKLTLVLDMAKMIVKMTDSHSAVDYVPMLPHETLVHHSDVSRAEARLGFVAKKSVKEAIDDYIEWVIHE